MTNDELVSKIYELNSVFEPTERWAKQASILLIRIANHLSKETVYVPHALAQAVIALSKEDMAFALASTEWKENVVKKVLAAYNKGLTTGPVNK